MQQEAELFSIERPTQVPLLPKFSRLEDVNVVYPIVKPYLKAGVKHKGGRLMYEVYEPKLDVGERRALLLLENGLQELFAFEFFYGEDHLRILERQVRLLIDELEIRLKPEPMHRVTYYLYKNFLGLKELEPFARDFFIEKIFCVKGKNLVLEHVRYGKLGSNLRLEEDGFKALEEHLRLMADDGMLPDGCSISFKDGSFVIVKPKHVVTTPITLLQKGIASAEMLAYLWLMVQFKRKIIFYGPAKSGKTTFLNALLFFVKEHHKLLSVEDKVTFILGRENWEQHVVRNRRKKLMLVQGAEADVVVIENIGYSAKYMMKQKSGLIGTLRADDMIDLMRKLQTRPVSLPVAMVKKLDVLVYVKDRKVDQILEMNKGEKFSVNMPFMLKDGIFLKASRMRMVDVLAKDLGVDPERVGMEIVLRARFLEALSRSGVTSLSGVQRAINEYYANPAECLSRWGVVV